MSMDLAGNRKFLYIYYFFLIRILNFKSYSRIIICLAVVVVIIVVVVVESPPSLCVSYSFCQLAMLMEQAEQQSNVIKRLTLITK